MYFGGYNDNRGMTLVTHIIIINALVWLASLALTHINIDKDIYSYCALHYWESKSFLPHQLFTYMFLHSRQDFMHVFFNMFNLFMFGRLLENYLGAKRFLIYYVVCGIGAGLVQEVVWTFTTPEFAEIEQHLANGINVNVGGGMIIHNFEELAELKDQVLGSYMTVGASGAVFGLLLAFGLLFPNLEMFIMFIPIPIKAKYMVWGYAAIELFFGVQSFTGDSIAHFAHLGGMLFGILMILYWRKKGEM